MAHPRQTPFDGFGDIVANTLNFDADKLHTGTLQLRDAVAVTAGRMAVKAADLTEQGVGWATPRARAALETAIEKATPVVEDTSERAQAAAKCARPVLEHAHAELVDDYLPRINRAVHKGVEALNTEGALVDRARCATKVSQAALLTPTKALRLKRRFLHAIGWTALAGTVAGVGHVLQKRSQLIGDPWTEEYRADLEIDSFAPVTEAEEIGDFPKE